MSRRARIFIAFALILIGLAPISFAADPSGDVGVITGKVLDQATGKGIPNVTITVDGGIIITVTDASGSYLVHVPPGQHYVGMGSDLPDGYLLALPNRRVPGFPRINVDTGQSTECDFGLVPDPNPAVEGRVIDAQGNPVAGATVHYTQTAQAPVSQGMLTTHADAAGRFHLHASPGAMLRARSGDLATPSLITIDNSGKPLIVRLSADAVFNLTVKIVDPSGAPVPGAQVLFQLPANPDAAPPKRISAGVLEFDGLTTDMPLRMLAHASDYGLVQLAVPNPTAEHPHDVELTVTLPKADQPVSGIVVDQDDHPAPGVTLKIIGPQLTNSTATTDAQGHFAFTIPKNTRANVMLILPQPYQAYAQIIGGRTDLKFYLPMDMTPDVAARADTGAIGGPQPIAAQFILVAPNQAAAIAGRIAVQQVTSAELLAKLQERRAVEINAQQNGR